MAEINTSIHDEDDVYPDVLPSDVSLDFKMTENNLFCVWYKSSPFQLKIGAPLIRINWLLCDPGEQLHQHLQQRAEDMEVLAFSSLAELRNINSLLAKKSFLSFNNVYFVEKPSGEKLWSRKAEGKVIFKGSVKDIAKLLQEGEKILSEEDYWEIFNDTRPVKEGHPEDWFYFMRDIQGGYAVREAFSESKDEEDWLNEQS